MHNLASNLLYVANIYIYLVDQIFIFSQPKIKRFELPLIIALYLFFHALMYLNTILYFIVIK